MAVVALLAITACQPGEQAAASVNGQVIKSSAIRSNLDELAAAAKKSGSPNQFAGAGRDTYQVQVANSLLSLHIINEILRQDLAKRKIKVAAADRTAGEAEVCTDPNTGQSTPGCLDQDPKALKDLRLNLAAQLQALGRAGAVKAPGLTSAQIEQEARTQYDQLAAQNPASLDQVCVLAAAVPDQASADSLKQQVEAGADFVTAATPVATQAVQTKEQCGSTSSITGQLATAPAGAVVTVSTQNGIFVVKVLRRGASTFAEAHDALVRQIQATTSQRDATARNQAGTAGIRKLLAKSDVQVGSTYGRWDKATGRVIAPPVPKGTGTTTTTSPAAAPATAPSGSGPPTPSTTPPTSAPAAAPATAPAIAPTTPSTTAPAPAPTSSAAPSTTAGG